jgi:hypothetical protein
MRWYCSNVLTFPHPGSLAGKEHHNLIMMGRLEGSVDVLRRYTQKQKERGLPLSINI